MSRPRRAVLALVASLGALPLTAQAPLTVAGRVVRVTVRGPVPLAGAAVTLHRIGVTSAGPVDSVVADRAGRYRFRVEAADTGAMYLPTARHGGLAYFAPPVRGGSPAADGEIEVFDTTSAPVPIRVTGRHLVISAPDADGQREVVEVYELQNDSVVTRLASPSRPAFIAPLPGAATRLRSTQGDFTGEAVVAVQGGAGIVAPVAPGVRQLAINYRLPASAFPLALTLRDTVPVFEVLLEEASARAVGEGLEPLGAVTSEGRSFVRFLGRGLPAGRRVDLRVGALPAAGGAGSGTGWLAGLGLAALGAIGWALRPRRAVAAPVTSPAEPSPAARERELRAAIDGVAGVLASEGTAPASHASLLAYRDQLQSELDAMLASRSGSG